MPVDLIALLADLRAESDELAGLVTDAGDLDAVLATSTPAVGWTVGDTIGHLWFFDREARRAAVEPEQFNAGLVELVADIDGYMARALETAAELGDGVLAAWLTEREELIEAFAAVDPRAKLAWYGPPMSPASSATARLMETWAHGQDVVDGLGAHREPTDRLRHIAHLGVRTRSFSYLVRGLTPPPAEVFVSLIPPSGGAAWEWGPADASDRISGPALDFCLLVTQRRVLADLSLVVTGDAAAEWASVAQIFAGLPSLTDPARAGLS